ncbi:hypothetical protein WJX74_006103 [Apatococcus lobatus]|uniref:Ferritin n=1 Tax=Apatococcus lobatus TaxID=904363 RepID=A0AAW1RWT3_9CHLO
MRSYTWQPPSQGSRIIKAARVVNERVQIVCLVIKFLIADLRCPVVIASHSQFGIPSAREQPAHNSMQALPAGRVISAVTPRAPQPLRTPVARRVGFALRATKKAIEKGEQATINFEPFDEVTTELANVEAADMSVGTDNFARVDYHRECEYAVNEQINIEYNLSYVYHSMASYFNRDNVGLPGLTQYFRDESLSERGHAQMLMDFQASRGGRVKLAHLTAPQSDYSNADKGDALNAMELALSLEKLNFNKLRQLHDVADKHEDAQMADFVEDMLAEQVNDVKQAADYVAQLRRVGPGHGSWDWDRALLNGQPPATPSAA